MVYIPAALRQQVIKRAKGRCEYCQTLKTIVIEMEIDPIIPESAGGKTELDNLCLSCVSCNGSKLDSQTGLDPDSGENVPLFNPRIQFWAEHFAWSADGTHVLGLTPTGRATLIRLKMNREDIVAARRLWVEAGWHPPKDLRQGSWSEGVPDSWSQL